MILGTAVMYSMCVHVSGRPRLVGLAVFLACALCSRAGNEAFTQY